MPFCGGLHACSKIFLGMIVRFREDDGPPRSHEEGDPVAGKSEDLDSGGISS